jgi:serine/threonine-protein kinase
MQDRNPPHLTRHAPDALDSDSTGFVLACDSPPEFVEATTRYDILSELGRGGAGIVYKARDTGLKRMVAIKVLRKELMVRPEIIHRFEQEARIICHLQHPGVAPVFECGSSLDGRPFHAMKLVNGQNMLSLVADGSYEKQTHAIKSFAQVCQTIAYTHSRSIIHLDLKPANFMIGVFGEVHVMDWGTARFLDVNGQYESLGMTKHAPVSSRDRSRLVGGTLEYMPPEQAIGGILDKRSDVFGLGACLCHILTGEPPYLAPSRKEVFRLAKQADLRPVHNDLRRSGADPVLIRLAIKCLQADPNLRPRDAGEVAGEMSSYQEAALARFQSDMTRFFDLSHDLFCIAGTDGYFRRLNANFTRVLGYTYQEFLAKPLLSFVHPEDQKKTKKAIAQLVEGKPVIRFRNRYLTARGAFIEFEWTAKSIPDEGLIFAVARELSEK